MNEKKKKILFSAYSLEIGGIETALINLLNKLSETNKYDITLVLERKKGILLNELKDSIKVIEYSPSYRPIVAKGINAVKRIKFILNHKNKYDVSFAYATYCKMASVTAQIASKNSNLWVHSSYLDIFNNNSNMYREFFKDLNVNTFKHIIFVSNKSKNEFEMIMKKKNTVLCNNFINYNKIIELSEKEINEEKKKITTFLYVGRITEDSKKISRLLEVANILKNKKLKFKLLIIGNGKDLDISQKYVNSNELNDYISFLGEKNNPYPYFKIADALVLVSENEGYPVVYNEAKILHLPIITTDVSDSRIDIDNKYGIVCEQSVESISNVMENVIVNGVESVIKISEKFSPEKYNSEIMEKIESIINERI